MDIEEGTIDAYLRIPEAGHEEEFLTGTQIRIYLSEVSHQNNLSVKKLGFHLRAKFERVSRRINGNPVKVYRVAKILLSGNLNVLHGDDFQEPENQGVASVAPY